MIRSKLWHWLIAFPRYRESAAGRVNVLTACSATAVMTRTRSGKVCVAETSSLFLPSATPTMAAGWGSGDG